MKPVTLCTFLVVVVGCSTGELPQDTATTEQAAFGAGSGGGTTPGPTCESPRCYESATSAYALKAISHGLTPAIDVLATANVAGSFTSMARDGIAAVTSDSRNGAIAVRARTTATSQDGPALLARASGVDGVPLQLINSAGNGVLTALSGSHRLQINSNGDMVRNHVRLGKRGQQGADGTDGRDGAPGDVGETGDDGPRSLTFACGAYRSCRDACPGRVVGEAVGTCEIALHGGGCAYGGTDGRCCACLPR